MAFPAFCLQEEFIVGNIGDMLACLRACNAMLRWSLLHAFGTHRKLRTAATTHGPSMDAILALALDTAALEHEVCTDVCGLVFVCASVRGRGREKGRGAHMHVYKPSMHDFSRLCGTVIRICVC